jgi:hypothetical protein
VAGFFCLACAYDALMGMKVAKITYHLERARYWRAPGATIGKSTGPQPEVLAARHEGKAAEYLAAGLREYARRAQTVGARTQRRRRRRLAGNGPGRGKRSADGWVTTGGRGAGWTRKTENAE